VRQAPGEQAVNEGDGDGDDGQQRNHRKVSA
jgi:hypothetical protein